MLLLTIYCRENDQMKGHESIMQFDERIKSTNIILVIYTLNVHDLTLKYRTIIK